VAAGYLYCWAVIGTEPAARRHGFALRLGTLLAGAALHAWLAKLMYSHGFPRGTGAAMSEIEAAAMWMYYGGDIAEIALASAFFARWYGDAGRRLHAAHAG
jgi:putative membrane protein